MIDDEQTIRGIVAAAQAAWNAGDADAYAARFHADGTFTNVFGDRHVGRDAFRSRHATIFDTFAKGASASFTVERILIPSPATALVDVNCALKAAALPPGLSAGPDGSLRTSLLLVLVKDGGEWWIAGYHNVDVKALPGRKPEA